MDVEVDCSRGAPRERNSPAQQLRVRKRGLWVTQVSETKLRRGERLGESFR